VHADRISDDLQKTKKGLHVILSAIFSNQSTLGTIFSNQSMLGAIFAVFSGILRRFSQILPSFPRILPGFSPNQNF